MLTKDEQKNQNADAQKDGVQNTSTLFSARWCFPYGIISFGIGWIIRTVLTWNIASFFKFIVNIHKTVPFVFFKE